MTIDTESGSRRSAGAPSLPPRRSLRWIAAGAMVIAAVTGIALLSSTDDGGGVRQGADKGDVAPDFRVIDLHDKAARIHLADFRGTPLVVNFFASWCTPCRKEMPALQAAASRYDGKIAFLGIDHKDSRSEALDLLASTGVDYATGFDQQGDVLRRYGLPDALPITLFLDEDGTVVERKLGQLSAAELDRAINGLLAG